MANENTFAEGATLSSLLDQINDGTNLYYWTGDFPKVVPANSDPASTGGLGVGAWSVIGDAILRSNLASSTVSRLVMGNEYNTVSDVLKD